MEENKGNPVPVKGKKTRKSKSNKLKTVRVPKKFEPIFKKAQEYVEKYFQQRIEEPEKGTIEIFDDRYILVRSASMSVEFFDTVSKLYKDEGEEEAMNVARNLLFDIAHAIGKTDAKEFHRKMKVKDPIEKLSAGPIHFSYSGWAFVDIFPESRPSPDENYYLIYDHPYSFESDAWLKVGKQTDFPVCVMNAGYSSGWCEESFGITLVATEITCKAKGDDACRFIMAPPSKIEEHIKKYLEKEPELAKRVTKYDIPGFFKRKRVEEALRESEEKYRVLVEEAGDGIVIFGMDAKITFINKYLLDLGGYKEKDVIGNDFTEFVPEQYLPIALEMFEKALEGVETPVTEIELKTKDGTYVPVGYKGSIMHDRKGEIIGVRAIIRDITERKHAEKVRSILFNIAHSANTSKSLRELLIIIQEELGKLIDTTNFYVALYDGETDTYSFPYCDDTYEKIDGEVGLKLPNSLTDYVRKRGKALMADTKKSRQLLKKGDVRDRGGVPGEIWLGAPLRTADKVIGIVAVQNYEDKSIYSKKDLDTLVELSEHIAVAVERKRAEEEIKQYKDHLEDLVSERTSELGQEIVERKEIEKALRESEQKLTGLFSAMDDLVFGFDTKGMFNFYHAQTVGRLYIPPDHFMGKHHSEVLPPIVSGQLDKSLRINSKGEVYEFEYSLKIGDSPQWFSAKVSPIFIDEVFTGSVGVVRDITERKSNEERFRRMASTVHDGLTIIENDKVVFVNERLCEILGSPEEELLKLSPFDLIMPGEKEHMQTLYRNMVEDGTVPGEIELWVTRKDGSKRYIRNRTSVSREEGQITGHFIITTDITERKIAEDDMKKRVLKFFLEDGKIYLVKEFRPNLSIEAFNDLLKIGYEGMIISRTQKKELQKEIEHGFEHIWLGEKKGEEEALPSLDFIENKIKSLRNKTVVLIDRLDYLIFKKGFNEALSLIYNMRDIISLQEQIIILSLDPSTITEGELNHMQKEMSEIEPRKVARPSEDIFEIVELIYEKNSTGIKPSFSELGAELKISKPTFRKRVRRLINNDYVMEITKGNKKVLELTQKGRSLFFK